MRALRDLQDETGGFQAFIPLPFLPGNTDFSYLPGPTREEKLRTIAVARLFLDSFPHIKGHWVMLGEEITSRRCASGSTTCRARSPRSASPTPRPCRRRSGLSQERMRDLIAQGRRQARSSATRCTAGARGTRCA